MSNVDKINTKLHTFVYDSHSKLSGAENCCGARIDNRQDAPICVLDKNEKNQNKILSKL